MTLFMMCLSSSAADFASPKAIANKIKAKGLQKLRFYCQMCNKQCRDENGFKCHLTSESHKRQMEVFGQNPNRVIHDYSREFERSFLEHLRRTHPFSRVEANIVYNEFIQDRDHVHMNATKWLSLTQFVKYLGREGKCKVDETPKGWFVTLIQEDPFEAMEKKKRKEREKSEREADERHMKMLRAQAAKVQKDCAFDAANAEASASPVVGKEVSVKISLGQQKMVSSKKKGGGIEFDDRDGDGSHDHGNVKKRSKVEELMARELEMKSRHNVTVPSKKEKSEDVWICKNIIVKVVSPSLKEHGYFKKKGRITKVEGYEAEIEMFGSGDVVRVDQQELETVVPSVGKDILVVRGEYKGETGTLESLEKEKYGGIVKIKHSGQDVSIFLEYDSFSKV